MKVVVHFGMPKAGSSALQEGLDHARPTLLEAGYLYPSAPVIDHNANFLMAGLVPSDKLPRFVRHSLQGKGDPEALFAKWIEALRRKIAEADIHTLILSAENLWEITAREPAGRLRDILTGLGATRIEAIAYVRRPSDWYLSSAQQVLRASYRLRKPGPIAYRATIEAFTEAVADPGATRVFPYDRAAFPEGDILNHFREAVLPGAPLAPAPGGRSVNETLSAEGMAVLQSYRADIHPRGNGAFTRDTRRVRAALTAAEADLGGMTRPRLHEELADRLDHGSTDLLWLAETHGVRFPGIDYDRVAEAKWPAAPRRVKQICQIDSDRRRQLGNRVLFHLAEALVESERAAAAGGGADRES